MIDIGGTVTRRDPRTPWADAPRTFVVVGAYADGSLAVETRHEPRYWGILTETREWAEFYPGPAPVEVVGRHD